MDTPNRPFPQRDRLDAGARDPGSRVRVDGAAGRRGAAEPARTTDAGAPPPFLRTAKRLITLALHPRQDLASHGAGLPRWATLLVKLIRYGLASVVGVVVSQVILVSCSAGLGWSGVISNLVAVTVSGIPNYFMNRTWTWDNHTEHSLWTDVVPFWGMGFAGLALSTVFVAYADHHWGTTLAISLANLLAFGLLWLVKFVVLDRLMFGRDGATSTP